MFRSYLNLYRFVALRHLLLKPRRTLLAAAGVALGIALFVAIQIINRSTLASFQESIEAIAGKSNLTVSHSDAGFPESVMNKIQNYPGVRTAVPLVVNRAYLTEPSRSLESNPQTLMVLGVDLLKESSIRDYKATDQEVIDDPFTFLNQPDSIIVTKEFADSHGLKLDSVFTITTARGARRMTVRGLLEPQGPARAYGGNLAIMDIDGARATFGKEGKLDRVDLVLREGIDPAGIAEGIRSALGRGYKVEDTAEQAAAQGRLISSYQTLLDLFSALAVFVGLFLIANTVSISVAERKKEIGTLRSLGTSRRQILLLFLSEAFMMGILGSAAGVWAGRVLAGFLLKMVTSSMSVQYATPIEASSLVFGWDQVFLGTATGGIASFLAALWPALKATSIQPMEAMKRIDEGSEKADVQKKFSLVLGLSLLGIMALSSLLGWSARWAAFKWIDPVAGMAGAALVGPFPVLWMVRLLRGSLHRFGGTVTRLAKDNLLQNPVRTTSNVRILMVGLILVILLSSLSGSFQKSVIGWYDRTLHADVVVSSFGNLVANQVQPIHESVGRELETLKGIRQGPERGAYAIRSVRIPYEGRQISLKAYDETDPASGYSNFELLDRPAQEAVHALYHSERPVTLVSENFARNFGKRTGDHITIHSPSGRIVLPIAGVVTDFSSAEGLIYLDRKVYKRFWNDPLVDGFALFAAPGYDPELIRREIDSRFGRTLNLSSVSQAEIKRQVSERITSAFSYTRAIEVAALAVALMGLLNTLLISVMERTQELGVLRALGMNRRQVRGLILQEAMLQGILGSLAAVIIGTAAAYFLVTQSLSNLLGWVLTFSVPWITLALTVGIGILVALVAGYYPSVRASRLDISEALEYE